MKEIDNASQPLLLEEFLKYFRENSPFELKIMDEGFFDDTSQYGQQMTLNYGKSLDNDNLSLFVEDTSKKNIAL